MAVYKARRDDLAADVDGLAATLVYSSNFHYDVVLDPYVAEEPGVPGPVHDPTVLQGEIKHTRLLLKLPTSRDFHALDGTQLISKEDFVV